MMHLFNGYRFFNGNGARAWALLLSVLLCASSASSVEAGTCAGGNPPIGSCSLKERDYPGEFPYAMTVIPTESALVVSDLFSGQFFKLNTLDIEMPAAPEALLCPVGPATYTGVAWLPTEQKLAWLVEGGTGPRLVISNSSGVFESEMALTAPAADSFLSGLTYKQDTQTLWTGDIINDTYHELTLTGMFTGQSFNSPGQTAFGGEVYGLGLTSIPSDPAGIVFQLEVTTGAPSDLRTARVERVVPTTGNEFGLFYDLNAANDLGGWITGIAWAPLGSSGIPSTYLADLTENKIVELPSPYLINRSVTNLTCVASPNNDVTLNWSNNGIYNTISILRDGVTIASIAATETSFTDFDVDGGSYVYEVDPILGVDNLPAGRCEVVVGFGRFLNSAPLADAFGVTVIESTNQVLVAELDGGMAHLFTKDLVDTNLDVPSPFAPPMQTAGVAWNSSDSTLLWTNGAGQIQRTDLTGGLIGGMVDLSPMPLEPTGDISYSALNNTFFGVSLSGLEVFEFQVDGTVVDSCTYPLIEGELASYSQGIAVVDDPTSVILDVPLGPLSSLKADRVRRLLDCNDSGLEYAITPSTLSGAIAGIAWTPAGSNGLVSEYMVGFDTGTIYEVSLDLSSVGDDFQRGDSNGDGVRDISDATSILVRLFVTGETFPCIDGADANDDGTVDIADATTLLTFLFIGGGPALPGPFDCGEDTTVDSNSCESYPVCP